MDNKLLFVFFLVDAVAFQPGISEINRCIDGMNWDWCAANAANGYGAIIEYSPPDSLFNIDLLVIYCKK